MSDTPPIGILPATGDARMNDTQARARVWTLCLAALELTALTGPLADLLTPLAHASSPALTILAAALFGTYVDFTTCRYSSVIFLAPFRMSMNPPTLSLRPTHIRRAHRQSSEDEADDDHPEHRPRIDVSKQNAFTGGPDRNTAKCRQPIGAVHAPMERVRDQPEAIGQPRDVDHRRQDR